MIVDEHGFESVNCSRLDGIGISRIRRNQIHVRVISSEKNKVVLARCAKLGVAVHNNVKDKVAVMKDVLASQKLSFSHSAFVGNDVNDIPALKSAGLSFGVNDRMPAIDPYLDFVSDRSGGKGAVREICDCICELLEKKRG